MTKVRPYTTAEPSDDKTIPPWDPAVELAPNYYCRGRNGKRGKYCAWRAGTGTSHPGVGRCKMHGGLKPGGDARVKTGAQSVVKKTTLEALIAEELERPDPLNLGEELAILRAARKQLLAGSGDDVDQDALQKVVDLAGRMVERIEKIRSQNAISRPELNRIMQEMWRAVDGLVADDNVKAAIRDAWLRIAL